jgi:uncharacterized protein (DUF3820 family)
MRMTFGGYKGRDVANVPEDYIVWALDNVATLSPTLRREMEFAIGIDRFGSRQVSSEIVGQWYRKMSVRFHPDHGGSHQAMVAVNVGRDLLLELTGAAT